MNAVVVPTNELSYNLRRYIEKSQESACDANQADHRSTSQAELDEIASRAVLLYTRGQELLKNIEAEDKEDLVRCRRLYALDTEYHGDDLVEEKVLGQWVLVPRYVPLIERMRKLRMAIM